MKEDTLLYKAGQQVYRISPSLFNSMKLRYSRMAEAPKWKERDPGVVGAPMSINLELTVICNLRCPFCWWWGENGIAFKLVKEKDPMVSKQLTTEEAMNLIDQAAAMGVKQFLPSGAELFVRKDIVDIIKHAASKGMYTHLTTNGTLITDAQIDELVQIKDLSMAFSIDGLRDGHDKMRGAGMFDKTVSTIKKLAEKRGKNPYPVLKTNTIFSPWLLGHEIELANFLQDIGVNSMHFQHLWFTNKEKADAHKQYLKETFGKDDKGVDSHIITMPSGDYARDLAVQIRKLESTRFRTSLFVKPQMTAEQIYKYYTDINYSGRKNCIAPWDWLMVKANGDVLFCPDDWVTYSVGNIREQALQEIWTGEKARQFRQALHDAKLFPACAKCCFIN